MTIITQSFGDRLESLTNLIWPLALVCPCLERAGQERGGEETLLTLNHFMYFIALSNCFFRLYRYHSSTHIHTNTILDLQAFSTSHYPLLPPCSAAAPLPIAFIFCHAEHGNAWRVAQPWGWSMPIFISCPITEAEQPRECSLESKRPHTERHVVTALEVQPKAQQQGVGEQVQVIGFQ